MMAMGSMVAGIGFVLLITGAGLFHLCLILGAPWGHLTMGGRWPGALPLAGRIVSGMSLLILAGMGQVMAGRAGLVAPILPPAAVWPVLAYLSLGVALHLVTPSAAERRLWLPVLALLLGLGLGIELLARAG